MPIIRDTRRWTILLASSILFTVFFFLWRDIDDHISFNDSHHDSGSDETFVYIPPPTPVVYGSFPAPSYVPGVVGNNNPNTTRALVIAATSTEDVSWIYNSVNEEDSLARFVYRVDDPSSENTVPSNKGHEVMVYLTHIIDHYDQLDDVVMFMHAHQITWHNNDLLDSDSAKMVKHLSTERVIREGYMNMRCHLNPGCPAHIRPLAGDEDINVPEAVIIGRAWKELFPDQAVPEVLSQPCCAQLAVSRDRIRALPRQQYIFFRNWLSESPLEDKLTGRVFEYVWQYIWTGAYEFCPKEHVCYCDGYGICFGGEDEYALYFALREDVNQLRKALQTDRDQPEGDLDAALERSHVEKIERIEQRMLEMKERAFERGEDPRNRAREAGRLWGDPEFS